MPIIKLQSSDGEVFPVDFEVAKVSVTIKTMVEELGLVENDDEKIVPLPEVNARILKKVIQWATYHKDDPPPMEEDDDSEQRTSNVRKWYDIRRWDSNFLKEDMHTLNQLLLAANYLNIKGLLEVTSKTVANMLKGKTPEEIRSTLNISIDYNNS